LLCGSPGRNRLSSKLTSRHPEDRPSSPSSSRSASPCACRVFDTSQSTSPIGSTPIPAGAKWNGTWDPKGLLSTLPAIGTCVLGVFGGVLLKELIYVPLKNVMADRWRRCDDRVRITVWLEFRILPAPPRSLSNLQSSRRLAKGPQLAGFDVGVLVSAETFFRLGGDSELVVSAGGNPVSRKRRPSSLRRRAAGESGRPAPSALPSGRTARAWRRPGRWPSSSCPNASGIAAACCPSCRPGYGWLPRGVPGDEPRPCGWIDT
jgi:hypothetical protein